jgi:hypothetical protein
MPGVVSDSAGPFAQLTRTQPNLIRIPGLSAWLADPGAGPNLMPS